MAKRSFSAAHRARAKRRCSTLSPDWSGPSPARSSSKADGFTRAARRPRLKSGTEKWDSFSRAIFFCPS